jgi:mannose/cellobiose epimerase-like protein (N-acyl-D-glucosamine 2-epimerase family)
MIENIIKSNLYRASPLITNNLAVLIRNLFTKTQYVDKTLDMVERLFDEIDEEYKKNEEENGQIGWKNLRKTHLFTEVLIRTETTFKSRLDDKLMRFFKRILDNFRKKGDVNELSDKEDQ